MVSEFKYVRRVEFSDTDMAGIMHFSRFFIFMESAEHAFFRSLGYSIHTRIGNQWYGWPRIKVECQYKHPLHFEDEVEIDLRVRDIGSKTLRYSFHFYKINAEPRVLVAEGMLTVVCVVKGEGEKKFRSVSIPEEIRKQLEVYSEDSQ
ncbi:MAG: acyl-CoA thioesterase [bacterium]|jgi:acyl-CoA thioester hydrolase